jgi:hypothetical protein
MVQSHGSEDRMRARGRSPPENPARRLQEGPSEEPTRLPSRSPRPASGRSAASQT